MKGHSFVPEAKLAGTIKSPLGREGEEANSHKQFELLSSKDK